MSLKQQAVSGLVWTFAEQFGSQIISFTISIVLARLLLPSDFGTIALFGVFIAVASTIMDGGLGSSLIRTKDTDEADMSTVFWFNVVLAVILYVIIYITAPFIANFYNTPILKPVVRIYCLSLIINSMVIVHRTRFIKELKFATAFKIQLPSLIIGGISGIAFAYLGLGIWSLVYSSLIQSVVITIQHWFYSEWKPKFIFDKKKFRYHFNYGYKMTLSGLLNVVFINIYTVVIGKVFSVQQLGYYNRADSLKQLPVSNVSNALNKVTFPIFAKISDNNVKLKEVYQKLMTVVIFIIAPLLTVMVVSAEPLVRFLLTDKWLPAVPYFRILSLAGLLYPIHAYNLNILQVKGKSNLFLKLEIIKKAIIVIVIVVSIKFGIYGLLWGQCITSALAFFVNTHYTGKILSYNSWQQLSDLLPTIFLAAIVGLGVYLIDAYFFIHLQDLIRVLLIILVYSLGYLVITLALQFKQIKYIKELLKK